MLFSGIENTKIISIEYSLLKKTWKLSTKKGKKIYVIPADKVLIKRETIPKGIKNKKLLKKYLSNKYASFLFDFEILPNNKEFYLVLVKDYKIPSDYFSLEPEPFALARLSFPLKEKKLQILDIGKNKTVYVEVDNNLLKGYRVILKGVHHILSSLQENLKISSQKAEELLKNKGCHLNEVTTFLRKEILNQIPLKTEIPLLLSGGGSKLLDIENLFTNFKLKDFNLVEREYYTPLGAALKFVYPNGSPAFKRVELTHKDFKILGISSIIVLISTIIFNIYLSSIKKEFTFKIKEKEIKLFKEKYPSLPPVEMFEQLETLSNQPKNVIANLFLKLVKNIPKKAKIYKIEYQNNKLLVEGEIEKKFMKFLKGVVSIKKSGNSTIIFKVEIK